jgi:phosphoribosylanthranilate isomerase
MIVKICGIKTLEDAVAALEAGADMLGFNFYPPSPRYIAPQDCAVLVGRLRQLGCPARLVGVFVNAPASAIASILDECGLDLAQLSGDEPAETLAALRWRAYKALRLARPGDLESCLARYSPALRAPALQEPAWLVDAYRPGEYGGTGVRADWRLASALADRSQILLAGGLTPDNVAEAVQQVHPWGVDVASGVELHPGVKHPDKMRAFIQSARRAAGETNHDPIRPITG